MNLRNKSKKKNKKINKKVNKKFQSGGACSGYERTCKGPYGIYTESCCNPIYQGVNCHFLDPIQAQPEIITDMNNVYKLYKSLEDEHKAKICKLDHNGRCIRYKTGRYDEPIGPEGLEILKRVLNLRRLWSQSLKDDCKPCDGNCVNHAGREQAARESIMNAEELQQQQLQQQQLQQQLQQQQQVVPPHPTPAQLDTAKEKIVNSIIRNEYESCPVCQSVLNPHDVDEVYSHFMNPRRSAGHSSDKIMEIATQIGGNKKRKGNRKTKTRRKHLSKKHRKTKTRRKYLSKKHRKTK